MCRLIETIKISNGKIFNIDYHNQRLNNSRKIFFCCDDEIDLLQHIHITDFIGVGLYKCRIICTEKIESVEIKPYIIKKIQSLKLVDGSSIDYEHKFADRSQIENLFAQRGACDDVVIIRNGFVTDTSICNMAFFNGHHWYTPEYPLLKGTKRQQLIDEGLIFEKQIMVADLKNFEKIRLFNAMIEFGEMEIPISAIT
ncbi:MAG TPA: aminotransferase class IV family protein [Bacteroidales bacterium]|nr:aminotransferase class IV family protein [Bacteroidales bacterium]